MQKENGFVVPYLVIVCDLCTANMMLATHINIRTDSPGTWQNNTGMKDINKHKCDTVPKHHMVDYI